MNSIITIPLLVAAGVVIVVYLLKKDEPDSSKKPNYLALFAIIFCLTFGVYYLVGDNTNNVNTVLNEIEVGEPDF
jgi:amino acid permease